jgi:hypothetical protein
MRLRNVSDTTRFPTQLAVVATALPGPRADDGKISLMTTHTIGPSENAKNAT